MGNTQSLADLVGPDVDAIAGAGDSSLGQAVQPPVALPVDPNGIQMSDQQPMPDDLGSQAPTLPNPQSPGSPMEQQTDDDLSGPQGSSAVGGRLGSILKAVAGVIGPGIAGAANQRGRGSFAGGMAGGAQAQLEYQFKTAADAARTAQLTMQDKELHLRTQEAQDEHDKFIMQQLKQNQDSGQQYDIIPNDATAIKQYMKASTQGGGITTPAGTLVTTQNIYIPKNPNTGQQFQNYQDNASAYLMPPLAKYDPNMYQALSFRMQGLKANGQAYTKEELPQQIAIMQSNLDNLTKQGVKPVVLQNVQGTIDNLKAQMKSAEDQKTQDITATANAEAATPQGKADLAVKKAQVNNLTSETAARDSQTKAESLTTLQTPDVTGFTPVLPPGAKPADVLKEYNKRQDQMKKNTDDLSKTEGTYQQFNSILNDINAGKDMNGAQSVVGLFNAIGISATPLKGAGFRINSNTIDEHTNARGLPSSLYQRLLALKNGDIITPGQLKDYASIAIQARHDQYVNAVNQAHNDGLKADFLFPRGNGNAIDRNTASIFFDTAQGNSKQEKAANARRAAQAMGWQVSQ